MNRLPLVRKFAMGLDLLDIVFRLEKAFGIKLQRGDLFEGPTKQQPERIYRTRVGDVYEVILRKRGSLGLSDPEIPLETAAVRRTRRVLAEVLGVSLEEIQAEDRLDDLLPRADRREQWRLVRGRLGGVRALVADRPWFVIAALAIFVATATVWCGFFYCLLLLGGKAPRAWTDEWLLIPILGSALGSLCTGVLMAAPIWPRKGIPQDTQTVKDLARRDLMDNRQQYVESCGGESDDDVWQTLRIVLADALGVEVDEVTKEADLIKDLGAD